MSKQSFVILSTTEGRVYLTHTATNMAVFIFSTVGFYKVDLIRSPFTVFLVGKFLRDRFLHGSFKYCTITCIPFVYNTVGLFYSIPVYGYFQYDFFTRFSSTKVQEIQPKVNFSQYFKCLLTQLKFNLVCCKIHQHHHSPFSLDPNWYLWWCTTFLNVTRTALKTTKCFRESCLSRLQFFPVLISTKMLNENIFLCGCITRFEPGTYTRVFGAASRFVLIAKDAMLSQVYYECRLPLELAHTKLYCINVDRSKSTWIKNANKNTDYWSGTS
jgi:hypothetical protein